ncbi:DUF4382 domain-containing protein [Flavobacterium sp.]|uniref:DUF4382 domain-containing protein n=1 Tax=Flavobacterium sp. TaxID=239 RepID=UPI00248A4E49|nr:DUF4382 domain-containing protein [Flavobacterium sp.]MDI1317154.1 DUF4382 domain-containing protein [Flavobacterium sp.]
MKKLFGTLLIFAGLSTASSCADETTSLNGKYFYKVRMTDAPGPYTKVNVDIRGVSIIDGSGKTVNLTTAAGIINLLELSNGTNMLLASSYLSNPEVKQIRLLLGPNNTVVLNNNSYPLVTPSQDQLGLKVTVNQNLKNTIDNEILIDFDAYASIVATGNNTYKLKPVLRIVDKLLTGSISGTTRNTSLAIISATSSSNIKYSTSSNSNGNFKIAGLPPGSYQVTITPMLPATPITRRNINVEGGSNTIFNTVEF